MTDSKERTARPKADRQKRLEEALRANLKRRKARARAQTAINAKDRPLGDVEPANDSTSRSDKTPHKQD